MPIATSTMSSSAVTLLDLSHAIGQQASSAKVASSPASSSSAAEPSASSSSINAADLLKQSGGPAIIALPDPVSTDGEERDYLVVPSTNDGMDNCCDIFEVQSLTGPSKYGSFFVGPRVVSDGNLRVATRVDPLFFVLAAVEAKSKQQAANTSTNSDPNKSQSAMGGNSKWQPLDQLLADVHPCVREALRNASSNADLTPEKVLDKQMRHLFLYTDAYGDDLPFYKFDEKLARKWLRAKFDRSLGAARASILREKLREHKAKSEASKLGGGGGAFSSAFNMGDDDDEEVATKPVVSQSPSCSQTSAATSSASSPTAGGANASIAMLSPEDETRARISALQLVCEYLPDAWRAKLMEEVEMTEEQLLGPRGKKRKAASPETSKASSVDEDDVGASMCFDDDEDLTAPPSSSSSNKWADNGNSAADRMLQITRGVDGCGGAAGSTANVLMDDEEREKLKKKEEKLNAKSHGLKKLAKVNTKGMKSLSSFFGGGPKKKKKV